MKYKFHPEALEEYREAANWYAAREPELGLRFIEAVRSSRLSKRLPDGEWLMKMSGGV